jgi:Cu/Ag efflux protein CusF
MMQRKTAWALVSALVITLGLAGPAASQDKASSVEVINATASVEAVNLAARKLTLKNEAGAVETFEVSPELKRLNEVKPGDRVQVQIYRAIAVAMNRHGETKPAQIKEDIQKGPAKDAPRLAGVREVTSTVTINDVDTANNLVSVTGPKGFVAVLTVKRPEMQAFIKQLKKGDQVDLRYTEAVVVALQPAAKK